MTGFACLGRRRGEGILCLVVLLALVLAHPGCDAKKNAIKPVQLPDHPQSSPANCLANLKIAYNRHDDINEYIKLFSDDFTFVFNPVDATRPEDPTPPSWGWAEERQSTERMFTSELTEGIGLNYDQDPAVNSGNEWPGTWKVLARHVRLQVDTRKDDGTQLTLLVEDGTGTFFFKEYTDERASDGKNLWRIVRWEDQTVVKQGALMTSNSTWGAIKNLFAHEYR